MAGGPPPVAVRCAEAGDGQPRHEEGLQDAVLNQVHGVRLLALVVILVAAAEPGLAEVGERGIVCH